MLHAQSVLVKILWGFSFLYSEDDDRDTRFLRFLEGGNLPPNFVSGAVSCLKLGMLLEV